MDVALSCWAGRICVVLIVVARARALSRDASARPSGGGFDGTARSDEESVHPGVLGRCLFLCRPSRPPCTSGCRRCWQGYAGPAAGLAAYSVSVFFLLRAAGRFLGAWMLTRSRGTPCWPVQRQYPALFSGLIAGGVDWAVYLPAGFRTLHVGDVSHD